MPRLQVLLVAYQIGFCEPRAEVRVDVAQARDSKCMHVISKRKRLDSAKARMVETSGKGHMPDVASDVAIKVIRGAPSGRLPEPGLKNPAYHMNPPHEPGLKTRPTNESGNEPGLKTRPTNEWPISNRK